MEVEYKNIDPKLIVNEIRNGRSIEAVQKLFGLRFKSEVQDLYMRGLMELGEIPPVDFGTKRGPSTQQPVSYNSYSAPKPVTEARQSTVVEELEGESVFQSRSPHRTESRDIRSEKPVIIRKKEKKPSVFVKTDNFRTIGQSGSITLNKALLIDQLGFSVGDTFEIYREDDKIVLQKTEAFGK
ncbi:MAG: AbrB/MazE/SpoVT family DNA-binding domain-containing protein [Syntrophobacterales bacterium]|nr:AbrB/MazE/SpoVT family DNA-binding domain-containing protein [Syntrophobacterales bacterium]